MWYSGQLFVYSYESMLGEFHREGVGGWGLGGGVLMFVMVYDTLSIHYGIMVESTLPIDSTEQVKI